LGEKMKIKAISLVICLLLLSTAVVQTIQAKKTTNEMKNNKPKIIHTIDDTITINIGTLVITGKGDLDTNDCEIIESYDLENLNKGDRTIYINHYAPTLLAFECDWIIIKDRTKWNEKWGFHISFKIDGAKRGSDSYVAEDDIDGSDDSGNGKLIASARLDPKKDNNKKLDLKVKVEHKKIEWLPPWNKRTVSDILEIYNIEIKVQNKPPEKPIISGPTTGKAGTEYEYKLKTYDPEGDQVRYIIDWGHGDIKSTFFVNSGDELIVRHTWSFTNNYKITVYAKDEFGGKSEKATLEVTMIKNKQISKSLLQQLFMKYTKHFPLITQIL